VHAHLTGARAETHRPARPRSYSGDSSLSCGIRHLPFCDDFGQPRGRPRSNGPAMACVTAPVELLLAYITVSSGSTRGSAHSFGSIENCPLTTSYLPP